MGHRADDAPSVYGVNGAFWPWLGFFLPLQMGRVAWEQKRWGSTRLRTGLPFTDKTGSP